MKRFEMMDNRKHVELECWGDKIDRYINDETGTPVIYDNPRETVRFKAYGDANLYIWVGEQQRSEMLYSGDRVEVTLDGDFVVHPSFFSYMRRMINQIKEAVVRRRKESKYGIRL